MALYVRQLKLGPMDNFVYLLGAEDARETAIIDPAWDVEAASRAAEEDGRTLTHALVSHHHFDHVNGLPAVLARGGIRVFAHGADVPKLAPELQKEVTAVAAGDAVEVGPLRVLAMHTPGHTEGSMCIYFPVEKKLIAGDTLFAGSIGRTDLPGGSFNKIITSLHDRVLALADETVVIPGHGPLTTIGEERHGNPFLVKG